MTRHTHARMPQAQAGLLSNAQACHNHLSWMHDLPAALSNRYKLSWLLGVIFNPCWASGPSPHGF